MKIVLRLVVMGALVLTSVSFAHAGTDAASVPENRIPWSGYWWPDYKGELVNGYSQHPAPFQKYDAYVNGYYPAAVTAEGLEKQYDPEGSKWHGLCDDWAAASIVEPEPAASGDLNGIPFTVGDKKGLLTVFLNNNFTAVMYGHRYSDTSDDPDDIYPGGVNGFHQTLINYIAIQGLPVVLDIDKGPEVWSHPAYRYEMQWYDANRVRHVTCKVWLASDFVTPDYVGIKTLTETYTYALELGTDGQPLDAPGWWEGGSIENHPDFMWFPTAVGGDHDYLDPQTVSTIVDSGVTGSDDRFESNDTRESAYRIDGLVKTKWYWGNAQNQDWYRVALNAGDDFWAFMLTPSDDISVDIFDGQGNSRSTPVYHGARISSAPQTAYYYVRVDPQTADGSYYNIEFYSSPSHVIPHIAGGQGWDTTVTLIGQDNYFQTMRLNLFTSEHVLLKSLTSTVAQGRPSHLSMVDLFANPVTLARSAKLINLDNEQGPYGFYSYSYPSQTANFPFFVQPAQRLILPDVREAAPWFTGLAIVNPHAMQDADVQMTAFDAAGAVVSQNSFTLGPGQNRSGFPDSFGPAADATQWVEFTASQSVDGIVLWGTAASAGNVGLAGIPLLREEHLGRTLLLSHVADDGHWRTEVTLVNPNTLAATVTVSGYTADGQSTGSGRLVIAANGRWSGAARELFGGQWDARTAWVKIVGDRDLCGYQLYGRDSNTLAALPLICAQQGKTTHWIKYLPPDDASYLGLALLNPNDQKADVWAEPLDSLGNNILGSQYLWYQPPNGLLGRHNAVGFVNQIFPGLPPGTVSLKIHSDAPIVGLGIFENTAQGRADVLYID